MFDINDKEKVIKLIEKTKKDGAYVVPLYVKIYNDIYGLDELDTMIQERGFNPASFRVGFGAKVSLFDNCSFPKEMMFEFDCEIAYSQHNDELDVDERYLVLEIGKESADAYEGSVRSTLLSQIHYYQDTLHDYLSKKYEEKKSMMSLLDQYSI